MLDKHLPDKKGLVLSIHSHIDSELNVVVITVSGSITVDELVAGYQTMFDDDKFKHNMNAIWDFSGLDLRGIPISDIRLLSKNLRGLVDNRGDHFKAALVTRRSVDYHLLRAYLGIVQTIGSGIRLRLCRSQDEAYTWVTGTKKSAPLIPLDPAA
jgi:hypothetical protein